MAVTRRTLAIAEEILVAVDRRVDADVRALVAAWARTWEVLNGEWGAAINDLVEMSRAGRWPAARQIMAAASVERALASTTEEIKTLAEFAGVRVLATARDLTREAADWQARLIASQLPETFDVTRVLNPLPDFALQAIVERTTEHIESWKQPLPQDMREAMRQALVRGVALGENPRTTARQMLARSQRSFNGGLTRALVLARTETLDAHRSAAAVYQVEQPQTLQGWVWNAKLDIRTCPSCWAKHGTVHDLMEIGPNDHPQGRCSRTPLTKSWADLGIDLPEPESALRDAEATFRALSPEDQLKVLGRDRLAAYQAGVLPWGHMSVPKQSLGWRTSWVPISAGDARKRLARRAG